MRALLVVLAVLISYGSLYPFAFSPADGSAEELSALFRDFSIDSGRGDIVGNILLFLPFGFLVGVGGERRRVKLAMLLLGVGLAVALQVFQIWIPGRVAALGDALINTLGLTAGFVAGAVLARLAPRLTTSTSRTEWVPILLVLLWIAYRWFPLVPTIDLQNVKDGLKPLLRGELDFVRTFANAVAWLVFFKLIEFTPARRLSLLALGMIGIAITLAQPLIVGGVISLNHGVGLGLALLCLPFLNRPQALLVLCLALLASLLLTGLHPFVLAVPINEFHWVPFTGMLEGSMVANTRALVEKCFLYGALVFLLHANGARIGGASVLALLWIGAIEATQIFVHGRTAEITDVVLVIMAGYAIAKSRTEPTRQSRRTRRAVA